MVLTAVAHVVLLKRCRFEETEFKSQQQVWMVKKKKAKKKTPKRVTLA